VSAIEYISKVALLLRLPHIRLAFAGRAREHTPSFFAAGPPQGPACFAAAV